jgi:hypothetical protein
MLSVDKYLANRFYTHSLISFMHIRDTEYLCLMLFACEVLTLVREKRSSRVSSHHVVIYVACYPLPVLPGSITSPPFKLLSHISNPRTVPDLYTYSDLKTTTMATMSGIQDSGPNARKYGGEQNNESNISLS